MGRIVSFLIKSTEQAPFFHKPQEVLDHHASVLIVIGTLQHAFELLIRDGLSKITGNSSQILERYLSGLVVVIESENLFELDFRAMVFHLAGHHLDKFIEFDLP